MLISLISQFALLVLDLVLEALYLSVFNYEFILQLLGPQLVVFALPHLLSDALLQLCVEG